MPSHPILFRALLAISAAALWQPVSHAQTPSPPPVTTTPATGPGASATVGSSVKAAIDAALAVPGLRYGISGVYVRSLRSGAVLYARNDDTALLPASCNKLLTVSTALTRLGPGFVYHTILYRTGTVDSAGVLTGDLILRGSGDPSFSADDLKTMARALQASGIREVRGRILADDSRFDSERLGAGWAEDDDAYDYQAQISALNCDENVVAVKVAPGSTAGLPAVATLVSGTGYAAITNGAVTVPPAAAGDRNAAHIEFDRARAENRLLVSGTIPVGAEPATAALTIEDPALFAVTRLAEILPACGVAVPAGSDHKIGHGAVPPDAVVVATKDSAPLSVLVMHLLKESDNLYAETLLKTVGAQSGTVAGSSREGVRAVRSFLQEAGIDVSGINQVDGCGLSRSDFVTPHAFVDLLTFIDQKSPADVRSALETALPIAGVDGTLRRRMKGTTAEGKVSAKTGSLNHVSCLAGFVTTRSGDRLAFAMMMNNYLGSASAAHVAQDKIAAYLAGL